MGGAGGVVGLRGGFDTRLPFPDRRNELLLVRRGALDLDLLRGFRLRHRRLRAPVRREALGFVVLLTHLLRPARGGVTLHVALVGLRIEHHAAAFEDYGALGPHDGGLRERPGIAEVHVNVRQEFLRILEDGVQNVGHGAAVIPPVNAALRHGRRRRRHIQHRVQAGQHVDKQVRRDATRILPPAAPAEEHLRVIRALLCGWTLEARPVDGLLGGVRRNRVHPGPLGGVPMIRQANHVHLADRAGLHQFPDLEGEPPVTLCAAALKNLAALLDRVDHLAALFDGPRHRLLAVDVLARRECVQHHLPVPVVRRRNRDGVHVLASEHRVVILRSLDRTRRYFLRMRQVPVVQISRDHGPNTRNALEAPQQEIAADTYAYKSHPDLVVRTRGLYQPRRRARHREHDCARKISPVHSFSIVHETAKGLTPRRRQHWVLCGSAVISSVAGLKPG